MTNKSQSRPSTNRASTITRRDHDRRERRDVVSAVNQPSKYDHVSIHRETGAWKCVSAVNQPSKYDHGRLLRRGAALGGVSAVNQPSKYDHTRTPNRRTPTTRGLGRQPTEQVRSPSGLTRYDGGYYGSRPSTNRASTIT